MKVVALLMALILLTGISSCQTPGMAEPDAFICTIIDDTELDCVNTLNPNETKEITLIDSIGFQCVSPHDFSYMKSHHEILHKELNKK